MSSRQNNPQRRQFLASTIAGVGGALTAQSLLGSTALASSRLNEPVSLKEAHAGTLEIDLRIMNQFGELPAETLEFYKDLRAAITGKNAKHDVVEVCGKYNREKIGGPMLGDLTSSSVSIWMHLARPDIVSIRVKARDGGGSGVTFESPSQAEIMTVRCDGLKPSTSYNYQVFNSQKVLLGEGQFITAPDENSNETFRMAFGADFHKIGMYRHELMKLIQERGSRTMFLIGDSSVDGRKDDFALIDTDYLLRDLSPPLQQLMANVPVYATWDDHDYWGNDASGTRTKGKKPIDVDGLRKAWKSHWNNPQRAVERQGIYFQTQIGPVHYIALDTRSCRLNDKQGELNSFLGVEQMKWLKDQISKSTAPFMIISSGTMWTDHISKGKDSWGKWDVEGREAIFQQIDQKKDSVVLLLSGDRHGARGFTIPRPNGKDIYEFEVGTLGGVPGPAPFAKDCDVQLFGLPSRSWAFGEFTLSNHQDSGPEAVFRLINEKGDVFKEVSVKI